MMHYDDELVESLCVAAMSLARSQIVSRCRVRHRRQRLQR